MKTGREQDWGKAPLHPDPADPLGECLRLLVGRSRWERLPLTPDRPRLRPPATWTLKDLGQPQSPPDLLPGSLASLASSVP